MQAEYYFRKVTGKANSFLMMNVKLVSQAEVNASGQVSSSAAEVNL